MRNHDDLLVALCYAAVTGWFWFGALRHWWAGDGILSLRLVLAGALTLLGLPVLRDLPMHLNEAARRRRLARLEPMRPPIRGSEAPRDS